MVNFFTNTYSEFVPTKVGDTIKEQALLAQTQGNQYKTAKDSYLKNQQSLIKLQAGQNRKELLDTFNADFENSFSEASNQGNFEDLEGVADKQVVDGYRKYNINKVLKDEETHQAEIKALQESDLPEEYKDLAILENNIFNSQNGTNEEGELSYTPYQPLVNRTNEDVSGELNKYISGMKADGFIRTNPQTGEFVVNKQIPGYDNLVKDTVISRKDVEKLALGYMSQNPNLTQSIKDEADVGIKSTYYRKGGFSKNDFLDLVSKDITFAKDSSSYNSLLKDYSDKFDEELELRRQYAKENDKPFKEQDQIMQIAQVLKEQSITDQQVNLAANKFGMQDSELIKFKKDKDINLNNSSRSSSGGGSEKLFTDGLFRNTTIATSDSQPLINYNNISKKKADLKSKIKELISEKATLQREGKLTTNDENITSLDSEIKKLSTTKDKLDNITKATAVTTLDVLLKKGIGFETSQKSGFGKGSTVRSKEQFYDAAEEKFNNASFVQKENALDSYKELNPDFEGKTLDSHQLEELINDNINKLTTGQDYNELLLNSFAGNIVNSVEQFKKDNPTDDSLFLNFEVFDINQEGLTTKDKQVYKDYNQTLSIIGQTLKDDLNNFTDLTDTPLSQLIPEGFQIKGDIGVNLISTNISGALVGVAEMTIEEIDEEGRKGTRNIKTLVNLEGGNNNGQKVSELVNQTFGELNTDLASNFQLLKPDKKRMLSAANAIVNISNGVARDFEELGLPTAELGKPVPFEFADKHFDIIPYKQGNSTQNKYLVFDDNTEVFKNGVLSIGRGVLGYGKDLLDSNTGKPLVINGKKVSPKYYSYNQGSSSNPADVNDSGELVIKDGFVPAEFKNHQDILERTTLDRALERGTFDINAIPQDMLFAGSDVFKSQHTNSRTVESNTDKKAIQYSTSNGYVPLNQIVDNEDISTDVVLPFVAFNSTGINKARKMFFDIKKAGLKPFITGGGRDENNVVKDGAEHSLHKEFGALDLIKNKAAAFIIQMSPEERLSKYGITKIVHDDPDHFDHLHIEFDKSLIQDHTKIDQQQF